MKARLAELDGTVEQLAAENAKLRQQLAQQHQAAAQQQHHTAPAATVQAMEQPMHSLSMQDDAQGACLMLARWPSDIVAAAQPRMLLFCVSMTMVR